jgi:hypothetical protein
MSDMFYLFRVSTLRRSAHISLFLGNWLTRLLSASVEAFLRNNFGRRYVHTLFGAFLLCLVCSGLDPFPGLLIKVFLLGLFARIIHHYIQVFHRRRLSATEPHSSSAGDSWQIWQRYGFAQTTVQRYIEPLLCWIVGLLVTIQDPFLGVWLKGSAFALLIKEQVKRFKFNRRIIDSMDAKLDAQALNSSLKQYQPGPGQCAQKSHRAHFPRSGLHPHP